MKKIYKILSAVAVSFLLPLIALATPSSVDRITDHIEPLIKTDYTKSAYYVASTTATSTFTGAIRSVCFTVDGVTCLTSGSGGGSTTTINGVNGPTFTFDSSNAAFTFSTTTGVVTINLSTTTLRTQLNAATGTNYWTGSGTSIFANNVGNVGVSTSSPTHTFSVQGGAGVNPFVVASSTGIKIFEINTSGAVGFNNSFGTSGFVLQSLGSTGSPTWVATSSLGISGGSGTVNSGTLGQVALYRANGTTLSGTSTLFFNETFNRFGIGTSSPMAALDIYSNNTAGFDPCWRLGGQGGGDYDVFGCRFNNNDGTPGGDFFTLSNATTTNPVGLSLELGQLTIAVGTTTPFAKFSVQQGAGSTTPLFEVASTTSATFATSSVFKVLADGTVGIASSTPRGLLGLNCLNTLTNCLVLASSTNGNPIFVVRNDGNLGIGSSTPRAMISVIAPTSTNAFEVTGGTGGSTNPGGGGVIRGGTGGTGAVGGGLVVIGGTGGLGGAGGGIVATGGTGNSNGAGGAHSLTGGTGGASGTGGAINLTGGTAGSLSNTGGAINILGGSTIHTGTGGSVFIAGGDNTAGTSTNQGNVILGRTGTGLNRGRVGIATGTPAAMLGITSATNTSPIILASSSGSQLFEVNGSGAVGLSNSFGTAGQVLTSNGNTSAASWIATSTLVDQTEPNIKFMQRLGSEIKTHTIGSGIGPNAGTGSITDGQMRFVPVYLSKAGTLNGVMWYQGNQGTYTGDNYNGVGLYTFASSSANGTFTLVASSTNNANLWKSATSTLVKTAFTAPYSAVEGIYFAALLYNSSAQTSAPQVGLNTAIATNFTSMDFASPRAMFATLSGQTQFPTSTDFSALSVSAVSTWVGVY